MAGASSCTVPPTRQRDQSYFLFATTSEQLAFLRFPLGDLPKAETRRIAARFGLPVADKPDSQDICFVPNGSYARVVEKLRPGAAEPGEIVHIDGRVLGRHDGLIHFTVGQRRGLAVATGERLYVVRLEPERARVIVGPKRALMCRSVELSEVNWLGDGPVTNGVELEVKHRAQEPAVPAATGDSWGWRGARHVRRAASRGRPGPGLRVLPGYSGARRRLDRPRAAGCGRLTPPGALSTSRFRACGGVAQLVEQWNHNPWVGGSSPSSATRPS